MAFVTETRTNGFAPLAGINAAIKTLGERYAQYNVYRATVAELSVLSNRELADLGVSRSAIKGIAIEAAYGK